MEAAKGKRYAYGHKKIQHPALCLCGCGEYAPVGKKVIEGHIVPGWNKVCACGCNTPVAFGQEFVHGHNARLRTPEQLEEIGKHISETKQANPLTEEQRKHLSEINKGERNPAYGKPVSEELRRKRGASIQAKWDDPDHHKKQAAAIRAVTTDPEWQANVKRKSGPEHPMWRGGVSKLGRGPGWSTGKRKRMKKRDGYKCVLCGKAKADLRFPLSIHHIDYDKQNHDERNLISLCRSCHGRVNGAVEECREFFIQYINNLYGSADSLPLINPMPI